MEMLHYCLQQLKMQATRFEHYLQYSTITTNEMSTILSSVRQLQSRLTVYGQDLPTYTDIMMATITLMSYQNQMDNLTIEFEQILQSLTQQVDSLTLACVQVQTQINLLDFRIQQLNEKLFPANSDCIYGNRQRMMTEYSTILGIRNIYIEYIKKKYHQISLIRNVPDIPQSHQYDPTLPTQTKEFCTFFRDI